MLPLVSLRPAPFTVGCGQAQVSFLLISLASSSYTIHGLKARANRHLTPLARKDLGVVCLRVWLEPGPAFREGIVILIGTL